MTIHQKLLEKKEQFDVLIEALNTLPSEIVLLIVDEYLAQAATHGPIVSLDDITADAAMWVGIATATEHRVYLGQILKVMGRNQYGIAARKSLFLSMWETFLDADKVRFIQKVQDTSGGLS